MVEIKMYSTEWCGWCARAKHLLAEQGYSEITEIDVDAWDEDRTRLETLTGQKTVPQIFVGDHHVGGYPELARLVQDGKLGALVAG
jgi:glutaredoxin 3